MKMSLDAATGLNLIQAYDAGCVQIGRREYRSSVLIMPTTTHAWAPTRIDELTPEHLQAICDFAPEVLLLGTGERLEFPAPAILQPLMHAGIGYEVMHNAAACRTFNIVLAEGRRAVLALILPASPDQPM